MGAVRQSLWVLVFMLTTIGFGQQKGPLSIGHRGAMGHVTENTLASIEKAMDLGVDMLEIDVFRIADGEIVVFHDKQLDRLTDATGDIESFTLEELKEVRLKAGGYTIPTLREVLDTMDAQVQLNIELKGANTAAGVFDIIEEYIGKGPWELDDFIISSFNWEELEAMRNVNSEIAIAVLISKEPLRALPVAQQLQAVAINPNYRGLSKEVVATMHQAGLKVYPWTVNDPKAIRELKDFGVDGVISDFPERVRE